MGARLTIDDILIQGRALLLDQNTAPLVQSPALDGATQALRDVRVPGKSGDIGTQGWTPGETGLPFGILTASRDAKTYPESGRVWNDWIAWLHICLAIDVDGYTDLRGWAYAWDDELTQWFPQYYRLGGLGLGGTLGDLWWKYINCDVGVFTVSGRNFFGVVARLHIHCVQLVNWQTGLSTVPS